MSLEEDWDTPPEGLVRSLMAAHGLTRAQALARLGVAVGRGPTAMTFRAIREGGHLLYRAFECVKQRPTVWDGRRRVPDRDYDYDLGIPDRRDRRANARIVRPVGPRRFAWLYIHPDARVEPLDPPQS